MGTGEGLEGGGCAAVGRGGLLESGAVGGWGGRNENTGWGPGEAEGVVGPVRREGEAAEGIGTGHTSCSKERGPVVKGKGDDVLRCGEAENPGPSREGAGEQGEAAAMTVDDAWDRVKGDPTWVPAWKTWSRQVVTGTVGGRPSFALRAPQEADEREVVGEGVWEEEELEVSSNNANWRRDGGRASRSGRGNGWPAIGESGGPKGQWRAYKALA